MAAADKLKELFGDRLTEQDCNNLISHGFGSPEALLDDAQRICLEDSLVSQGAIKVVLAWQAEHLSK